MDYQRLLKMKDELKDIRSNFVSISKDDYNSLLKITEEDTICISSYDEVELDVNDLKILVGKCIKHYERILTT